MDDNVGGPVVERVLVPEYRNLPILCHDVIKSCEGCPIVLANLLNEFCIMWVSGGKWYSDES